MPPCPDVCPPFATPDRTLSPVVFSGHLRPDGRDGCSLTVAEIAPDRSRFRPAGGRGGGTHPSIHSLCGRVDRGEVGIPSPLARPPPIPNIDPPPTPLLDSLLFFSRLRRRGRGDVPPPLCPPRDGARVSLIPHTQSATILGRAWVPPRPPLRAAPSHSLLPIRFSCAFRWKTHVLFLPKMVG